MVSLSGKTARLRGPCTQTRVCAHGQQLGPKVQALLQDASSSSTSRPCGDRPGTRAHSVPSAPQVRTRRDARAAPSHLRRPQAAQTSPLSSACARALLGVPWRLSPPSGARESGQRAGAASLSRSWAQSSPSPPATWPCPHYQWLHRSCYLAMGPGRWPEEPGWEPAAGRARLPHPRRPQKRTNKKANTPEAGPAACDATRNDRGLFFVGAQLLPRRRRQRLSVLSGHEPPSPTPRAPRHCHQLLGPCGVSPQGLHGPGPALPPAELGAVGAAQGESPRERPGWRVCECVRARVCVRV